MSEDILLVAMGVPKTGEKEVWGGETLLALEIEGQEFTELPPTKNVFPAQNFNSARLKSSALG